MPPASYVIIAVPDLKGLKMVVKGVKEVGHYDKS